MSARDCLRPPAEAIAPETIARRLERWAHERGWEIVETDLQTPGGAAEIGSGVLGTVGSVDGRHAIYLQPGLTPQERALTIAHEAAHLLLETGQQPGPSGGYLDPHGQLEPRAYAAEAMVGVATGLYRLPPGDDLDYAGIVRQVGWAPLVAACQLAQVARGGAP